MAGHLSGHKRRTRTMRTSMMMMTMMVISDDSISGFQFRYDVDTILTKYRDMDTISIFCKCERYASARTVTRHKQGSMLYLDNKKCVFE